MMPRFVAMIVLLAACLGCKGKKADTGTDSQQIDIYFTCDTNGRIEPCGCFTGQYGELTRVSTALKEAPGSADTGIVPHNSNGTSSARHGCRDCETIMRHHFIVYAELVRE